MPKALLLSLEHRSRNPRSASLEELAEYRSRRRLWNMPHLGLLTVGALLAPKYDVDYVDLEYDTLPQTRYDCVFLSPTTPQVRKAYVLAEQFQKRGMRVIMGGPHATMLPEEALKHADAVFVGEAERSIGDFLSDSGKRLYSDEQKPPLSESPLPLYELAAKYPYSSMPIQLSRGCPHRCEFCLSTAIYGGRVRRKDPEQAEKELAQLVRLFKNPFVFFTDDNFFTGHRDVHALLDLLSRTGVRWYAFTDISVYRRKDILSRLYDAGCRKLLIGFESLDAEALQTVNPSGFKKSRIQERYEAVEAIQRQRIGVIGSFVLGLERDTEQTFEDIYRFIWESTMYGTNLTVATPFPGTAFYRRMQETEKLPDNWDLYDGFTLLYKLRGLPEGAFEKKYEALLRRVNSPERVRRVMTYFHALDRAAAAEKSLNRQILKENGLTEGI